MLACSKFVAYKSNAKLFEVSCYQGGYNHYLVCLNMFIKVHQKFIWSAWMIAIQRKMQGEAADKLESRSEEHCHWKSRYSSLKLHHILYQASLS